MRKSATILVIIIYLFSYTEARELLKLPFFIEHFAEHKKIDEKLSLADFIHNHYLHLHDHDSDTEKDNNLPFKSHNSCASIYASTFCQTQHQIFQFKQHVTDLTSSNGNVLSFKYSSFPSSIWQPPKI